MDEDPSRTSSGLRRHLLHNVRLTGTTLGAGAYGTVEEVVACPRVGKAVIGAAKKIHSFLQNPGVISAREIEIASEQFVNEWQFLASLRHPNIVKFLGLYYFPGSRLPALVMERLLISLHNLLNPPDRPRQHPFHLSVKCSILSDVANGLAHLHGLSRPITHRDLTARNVVLDAQMQAKLVDLGLSRIEAFKRAASTMTMGPGTLVYLPPEATTSGNQINDPSIDIFSFGVITIFTIGEIFPCDLQAPNFIDENTGMFLGRTEFQRRSKYIQHVNEQVARDQSCGERLITLIEKCLHNLPAKRPNISEVVCLLGEAKAGINEDQETGRSQMEQAIRMEQQRDQNSELVLRAVQQEQSRNQEERIIANLESPYGITVSKSGEIFVTEWKGDRVSVFDISGKCCRITFGICGKKYPAGIAVDEEDRHIYVSSQHQLQKFSMQGELLKCIGKKGRGDEEFDDPRGLAIYKDHLYVSDRNNHRIQVFDLDLNFFKSIGSHGQEAGKFNEPFDVKFDPDGNMYVAEFKNNRIQILDSSGHIRMIGGEDANKVGLPTGLHVAQGKVYVSDLTYDRIVVYETTGEFIGTIASRGSSTGELCSPYCIASNDEKLFVCDSANDRVHIFDLWK